MVRTVHWGQVPDDSREPESWNEFDVENTADKLEVKDQLLEDGCFADPPELRLLSSGNAWRRWDKVQALPAGDLKIKVICRTSGEIRCAPQTPSAQASRRLSALVHTQSLDAPSEHNGILSMASEQSCFSLTALPVA